MLYGLLPVLQKVGLVAGVGWLLAVYYAQLGPERESQPSGATLAPAARGAEAREFRREP